MLSLELLAHSEGDRAVVEGVVCLDVRVDIALHSEKEQATLRHVERHLADDLLKALLEELFTYRADTTFSGLALHQLLVKHLTEPCHVDPASRLGASLLNPVLAALDPFTRWDNSV